MTTKKTMAIGVVFALAAMLFSSGNALNTIFAQSNNDREGNDSGRENFEDFIECLREAEGNKGFATEQQIRDCFSPIYNTGTTGTGTGATGNTAGGNDNDNDNTRTTSTSN